MKRLGWILLGLLVIALSLVIGALVVAEFANLWVD